MIAAHKRDAMWHVAQSSTAQSTHNFDTEFIELFALPLCPMVFTTILVSLSSVTSYSMYHTYGL